MAEGTLDKHDDNMWEYVLRQRLQEYIPYIRQWWADVELIEIKHTGIFKVQDTPNGLYWRATNTPARSPIKGVQVFPFIPVVALGISGVPGGVNRMVTRICDDNRLKIDEFTVVEKSNLPSTYHQGQFLAFVPTSIMEGLEDLGRFVYLTMPEMLALNEGKVLTTVKWKLKLPPQDKPFIETMPSMDKQSLAEESGVEI